MTNPKTYAQKATVFKAKELVVDQEKASELDLYDNCLIFYAAWEVYWKRAEAENLTVLAKRSDKEDLVEMFQVESAKAALPIGCGLVTICGKQSEPNNVCVFFRFSDSLADFNWLLVFDGDMSDFVGAAILSKKDGLAINAIIDAIDAR